MKANEFMVGDLATIHLPGGKKVTRLLDIGDLSFFVNFDPVPLSSELLLKNGFVGEFNTNTGITCSYERNSYFAAGLITEIHDRIDIKVAPETGHFSIYKQDGVSPHIREFHGTDLKYIHELQHALKLCDIKIEINP